MAYDARSTADAGDSLLAENRKDIAKRAIDIAGGGTLFVVVLPIIGLCMIGVALTLRTWPLFTQRRIGRGGRAFRVVKVRTLPVAVPRYAAKHRLAEVQIPRFCRVLRRLHLDELPQLAQVVSGKMSLVGPRPEMPFLHSQFPPDFARVRTRVRPGCTGLWQISEHCDGVIGESPEFDELYVRHHTVKLDLWIMARTIRLLLPFGRPRLVTLSEVRAVARHPAPARTAMDPTPTEKVAAGFSTVDA